MRRLLNVRIPQAEFNAAVKDSSANQKLGRILEQIRPEAVYFTERGGHHRAFLIVDVDDTSKLPALAEPKGSNWSATMASTANFQGEREKNLKVLRRLAGT